jgi:hypothetical protein
MTLPVRSIRLIGRNTKSLDSTAGDNGEIFYDTTNDTLRLYDGKQVGGYILARVSSGGGGGGSVTGGTVTASDTPPTSPSTGSVWFNTTTNKLYIYEQSYWVQPSVPQFGAGYVEIDGATSTFVFASTDSDFDGATSTATTSDSLIDGGTS